jgi:hypothetical protein
VTIFDIAALGCTGCATETEEKLDRSRTIFALVAHFDAESALGMAEAES